MGYQRDQKAAKAFVQASAVERLRSREPTPRHPGMVVDKFVETGTIPEDNFTDADIGAGYVDLARELGKRFDNACLAATSRRGSVPTISIYAALRTTNEATGYVADTNYLAASGEIGFEDLSEAVGRYEESILYDDVNTVVIASPGWKPHLRRMRSADGHPAFMDHPQNPTLLDYPITWSMGCRTSEEVTNRPQGNPLLIVGNRGMLIVEAHQIGGAPGCEPGFVAQPPGYGPTAFDDARLRAAVRRGFVLGDENAFVVIERLGAKS